jgi:hypothetical protein
MVIKQVVAAASIALVVLMVVAPPLLVGQIAVQIRPNPAGDLLQSLNITVTEISAHRSGMPETTGWVTMSNETRTLDLLRIANITEHLVSGTLSLGRYDRIRLFVANATALVNGTSTRVELPQVIVDIPVVFDSRYGINTTILVAITGQLGKEDSRVIWDPSYNATIVLPT